MQNTYPRLERLEAALHGVDNLAGRTIAMDTMAEDLAVPIPTLNTSPLGTGQDGSSTFHTTSVATGSPMGPPSTLSTFAPAVAGFAQREPGSYAPTALLDTAASFMNATQSPETAAAADATRKSLATGQQPRTIKALHDGMQELREDNEALRMCEFSEINSPKVTRKQCCIILRNLVGFSRCYPEFVPNKQNCSI